MQPDISCTKLNFLISLHCSQWNNIMQCFQAPVIQHCWLHQLTEFQVWIFLLSYVGPSWTYVSMHVPYLANSHDTWISLQQAPLQCLLICLYLKKKNRAPFYLNKHFTKLKPHMFKYIYICVKINHKGIFITLNVTFTKNVHQTFRWLIIHLH